MLRMAMGIAVALVAAGCHSDPDRTTGTPSLTPTAVSTPVSRFTWSAGPWPFTVADVTVKCYLEDSMVTVTAGGVEYGLNRHHRERLKCHAGERSRHVHYPPGRDGGGDAAVVGSLMPVTVHADTSDRRIRRESCATTIPAT